MRNHLILCSLLAMVALSLAIAAGPTTEPDDDIVYKPPIAGAPLARVGGGSRGATDDLPTLAVLVPEHAAYTTKEQPVLYWFVSKPTTVKCEISITDMSTLDTVYETSMDGVATAGIQKLDLAKENVKLKPGVQYQWLVALVPDPSAPSKNVDAGGFVTRTPVPEAISTKLGAASPVQKAALYAQQGIWFDALDELCQAIDANPGDASLHQKCAKLLEQIGLKDAAAFESAH